MLKNLGIEKILTWGFASYILVYAFFSLECWFNFKNSFSSIGIFPKHIFQISTLYFPCLIVLIYFYCFKKEKISISLQDCIFSVFILYLCLNLLYVVNTALALEGITIYITVFLTYLCFKQLFAYHKRTTEQILKTGLALLGIYFIYHYVFTNFDSLISLMGDVNYQDTVRNLKSLVGTKNVTSMFIFAVFVLHRLSSSYNENLKYIHTFFQFSAILLIILIGSRNVYIAMFVYFISEQILGKRKLFKIEPYSVLLVGILFAVIIFLSFSTNFINHLLLDTLRFRIKMWEMSLNWIAESPLTGIGVFHFNAIKPLYDFDFHGHPHNDYVRTILELGLIGFVIFTSIWILQLYNALNRVLVKQETMKRITASIIAFQSLSIFDGIHYKIFVMIFLMIVWAKFDVELMRAKGKGIPWEPSSFQSKTIKLFVFSLLIALIVYPIVFLNNNMKLQKAIKLVNDKQYQKAEYELLNINQSVFYDGVKTPIYVRLGKLAGKQNDPNKAFEYYKLSLIKFPLHRETNKLLAQYHIDKNERDLADEYLRVLLAMDYKDRFALKNLSDAKINKNKSKLKKRVIKTKKDLKNSYFK